MDEKGKILFKKFSQLKYPNINKFSPSSFDWLFDNEEALPFLNWFCLSVQSTNILCDTELKRYESIVSEGVTVLEGKRLKEALDSHTLNTSSKEVEMEVAELREVRDELRNKKKSFINQLNILNLKENEFIKTLLELEMLHSTEELKTELLVTKLKCKDEAFIESICKLEKTSSKVTEFLSKGDLLCQSSFNQFLSGEEECTSHLTDYANKQFEQNMGQMGQNSGLEKCAFFQVGNPNFGDCFGLREDARLIQNWELDRLHQHLPLAEEDRIVSETEFMSWEAAKQSCYKLLSVVSNGTFSSVYHDVRDHVNYLKKKNSVYVSEIVSLEKSLLNSVSTSTQLRCSSIIVGDCSLKLLRQEFFITKQKEFFSLIVQQWAREQLMLLALRLEWRQLETLVGTLKNALGDIQAANVHAAMRQGILKDVSDLEKSLQNRNTIPRNDEISCSLSKTLSHNFHPLSASNNYEDLDKMTCTLQKQLEVAKLQLREIKQIGILQLRDLQKLVLIMEELVFGKPLICVAQRIVNRTTIENSIASVDTIRNNVQSKLKPLYREFKSKQNFFKNDHLVALERRLWTLFYTDVTSMIRKIEALNAKALSI